MIRILQFILPVFFLSFTVNAQQIEWVKAIETNGLPLGVDHK